jgi:hypothetical protein
MTGVGAAMRRPSHAGRVAAQRRIETRRPPEREPADRRSDGGGSRYADFVGYSINMMQTTVLTMADLDTPAPPATRSTWCGAPVLVEQSRTALLMLVE